MIISYRWLLSIAPTIQGTPRELADRLGMLGAPVDELTELGAGLGDILIARVEEVWQHPDADRLRVCKVNAGGEVLQVVCGAPNVEAGRYYPLAPIGARLPGGAEIGKVKLRGQASEGMLCSARELELGRDHAGLMTLNGEWRPGSRLLEELELRDARLMLDVTPNRSDLLSHVGVARELAPRGWADVELRPFSEGATKLAVLPGGAEVAGSGVGVTIADPADCPRYMAAVIEGVRVGPSPEWLATRLRAVGLRPINNVVDATNYVLHELGQPLHAFDLDTLQGQEIVVRRARPGESLRTLDGVDRKLESRQLVIADRDRPVALAGVMGGEETEVTEKTTRVLIECALFDSRSVRGAARSFGISTDASHRFERGVDWEGQPRAVERVIDLILSTAGGSVVGPALDAHPAPAARGFVQLRPHRIQMLLGVDLKAAEVTDLLTPIGFGVGNGGDALRVEVPPYRPDVTREADIIEEIARRRGYDSFDAELSHSRPGAVPEAPIVQTRSAVHRLFERWGFREARTAAFSPTATRRVPLLNPLSSEESHLRDDLVGGLVRRVQHNWAHGVRSIRLYEIGSVFQPADGPIPGEELRLAAIFTGPSRPPHWSEPTRSYDLWDLKGLATEVAEMFGARLEVDGSAEGRLFEAGEAFAIVAGKTRHGAAGRVGARLLDPPAWAEPVWALEVRLETGAGGQATTYVDLPAYPAVERDIALLVPGGVTAVAVEGVIDSRAGSQLETFWPFDQYVGEGVAQGARSIAWRLRFRHPERTLTDAEVEASVHNVLKGLEEELGVHRR